MLKSKVEKRVTLKRNYFIDEIFKFEVLKIHLVVVFDTLFTPSALQTDLTTIISLLQQTYSRTSQNECLVVTILVPIIFFKYAYKLSLSIGLFS